MSLIEIESVTKTFSGASEEVTPLENLSLRIEEGEFVALMGPSGSGKTTLLNLMAGIDRPTAGSVRIAGEEVSTLSARALAKWRTRSIGFVFQGYNLIPVLTAYENVEIPLLLLDLPKADRRRKVLVALDAVGLSDRAHHLPRQMSGGQQQRVAIARAIVADPKVVLADEPTGNLDRTAATATLQLLRRLNTEFKKTLVMVTHDPLAAEAAKRIVHLDKGKIVDGEHAHA
ncbi:MAG TPA: ABC transporter ATP-binding protein [Planctomycetota bacterium]|nr:ABC transporter ATP-binding protein [Planctomycetota bacterium]